MQIICHRCGFWDSDYESCTCPSTDMWYACPIESKKLDDQALKEYDPQWTEDAKND